MDQIQIVERFYAALDARDLDALTGTLAEDVIFNAPQAIPFGGRLVGRDAVRGFVTDAWGFFEEYTNVRERMVAHEDRVVVFGRHSSRPADGAPVTVPYQSVLTVRDGLIAEFAMQVDAGLVVKAVAAELASEPAAVAD
jgi:ketosteroid isomerase-like protein